MIQGAIFDVDGTILDSMPIWDNAAANYLKDLGIEAEPELGKILYPMTMTEGSGYLKEKYQLKLKVNEIILGVNNTIHNFYLHQVQLKPGMGQFLQDMKQSGIRMTIATSSDRCIIESALSRLNVLPLFDRIFTCSEIGTGKNHPDIYFAAQKSMQTPTSSTWVFEDALHAILTAGKAGFKTVGIFDPSSSEQQDEIKELSDIYMYKILDYKDFIQKIN